MRILGVIIAGGQSRRMGGREKAFVTLAGKPLLAWVVERMKPQVSGLVINANGDAARFAGFGLAVFADRVEATGTPLAGLEAGLSHASAQGFDAILSVPSDSPFLPLDLAARLAGPGAAIAQSAGQDHYVTGFWPASLLAPLQRVISDGSALRLRDWANHCAARRVAWSTEPLDPFFNINSPEDLARAQVLAGGLA